MTPYNTIIKNLGITNEDVAKRFGYANSTAMRNSSGFKALKDEIERCYEVMQIMPDIDHRKLFVTIGKWNVYQLLTTQQKEL